MEHSSTVSDDTITLGPLTINYSRYYDEDGKRKWNQFIGKEPIDPYERYTLLSHAAHVLVNHALGNILVTLGNWQLI